MNGDISLDVGSAVPYLVESFKSLFGKDASTIAAKERSECLFRSSIEISLNVQCVGMWKPIPISKIYQPTRLCKAPRYYHQDEDDDYIDIFDIIEIDENAVIVAGPGEGKTVFMHWVFMQFIQKKEYLPLLFTLRWPNAINDLGKLLNDIQAGNTRSKKKPKILLLIDGYDEVDKENRKRISDLLRIYSSLKIGTFLLTCRTHYDIYDLPAPQYWIAKFNFEDALGFSTSFMEAYGVEKDIETMLFELKRKGFESFTEHPLMLTLVCILSTSPHTSMPRSSLGLIRRAIDTLTLRWDESKGIARESTIPLDGEERVRCLMRVAYELNTLIGNENTILRSIMAYIQRQQVGGVDARKLLLELSQWYGFLVPASADEWTFVHRTIHDFLAARYWVESGEFDLNSIEQWNTRSAYAMCIVPDATKYIQRALGCNCEMHVFSQCLINNAIFDTNEIARSVITYFKRKNNFTHHRFKSELHTEIAPSDDFFHDATFEFLEALTLASLSQYKSEASNMILAYSLYEFYKRNFKISNRLFTQVLNYFDNPKFSIRIRKGHTYKEVTIDQIV